MSKAAILAAALLATRASGQRVARSGPPLDRVVAAVGNSAVTESDVIAEYRYELFQKGKMPRGDPSPAQFRSVMKTVINQRLLVISNPSPGDRAQCRAMARQALQKIREELGSATRFNEALKRLRWSRAQAEDAVAARFATVIGAEQRFHRRAEPTEQQVAEFYREHFLPQFVRQYNHLPPPLSQIQNQVRAVVAQRNVLRLLEAWLARERAERKVRIFQP